MNKLVLSFAVLALINNASAIRIADSDDDLFTDNASEAETLQSISQAEKATGSKFNGISAEDQHNIVGDKNKMTFENDQFVKSEKRTYINDKTMLQIDADIRDFGGQPIGTFAQVRDGYRTAEYDSQVLAGTQLNDEDDAKTTLESLKSSENISGTVIKAPQEKEELFQTTGSQYINLIADENKRVSTAELDNALLDHDDEEKIQQQKADAQQKLEKIQRQEALASKKKVVEAEEEVAEHFRPDGLTDME